MHTLSSKCYICSKRRRLVNKVTGHLYDENPERVVPRHKLDPGDKSTLRRDKLMWPAFFSGGCWWNLTHERKECVFEAGCTEQELYSHGLRLAAYEKDRTSRQRAGTFASVCERRRRGTDIRARLGLEISDTDVPDMSDLRWRDGQVPTHRAKAETRYFHRCFSKASPTIDMKKDKEWRTS